ncbi:MAG: hypothetical protein JNK48_06405, partial [Bryobacterales bacterium]|nr:hypothetical protein [Bryobacterales bacterium]
NCAAMEGGGAMRGGPLASTQVEGGRILPYTEVFCDRLEQVLAAGWGSAPLYRRHVLTGRAMARVLAHEIYHFLAQEKGHAGSGVAKNCFHHRDLLGEEFAFDEHTAGRMRGRAEQGESGEEEPAGRE